MSIAGEFGAGTPGGTAYSNTIGANVANGGMAPLKKDASGNVTSLVDGAGNRRLPADGGGVSRRVLRRLSIIGDSLSIAGTNPALPDGVGAWDTTGLSNLNVSGSWLVSPVFDGRGASGTAGTLSTDGAGRLRWQWTSDAAPGAWVDVSDGGFYEIPSVTPERNMYVSVIRDHQPAVAASDVLTATVAGLVKRVFASSHAYSEMLRDVLPGVSVTSYGISGDRVGNVAARWGQMLDSSTPDAIIVLIGTNNVPTSVATAQTYAATTVAMLREMQSTGIRVYVGGMFPRTDVAAASRDALSTYSDILRDFCAENGQFVYWDAWPVLVSGSATDGTLKSGAFHTDNLHLMPYGAWLAKNVIMGKLQNDWALPGALDSSRGYVAWDSASRTGSVNANPKFKGSGGTGSGSGGVTGTVPASWTITRTAGTQTCALSTSTNSDGQDSWVWTLADSTSAATIGTGDYHQLTETVTLPSGLGEGDFVVFELDMEIQQADLLQKLEVAMVANSNIQSAYWGVASRTFSNFAGSVSHRVTVRSERLKIMAGVTSFTLRIRAGTASGGSAVLAFRRLEVLEVV